MRRLTACVVICSYLSLLGFGLFSHVVGYKQSDHVGMYFIIWDMYCGWCAHEVRHHIIAEGESGQYYEVTPAPWGEFSPYASIDRHHYDGMGSFTGTLATHILDHTEHEPIAEVTLVEEAWSKKYNIPDEMYLAQNEVPKQKRTYFRSRSTLSPTGEFRQRGLDWIGWLSYQAVVNNPRLQQKMKGQPFVSSESYVPANRVRQASHETTDASPQ